MTEKNDLLYAIPGGLVSVGLKIDPCLTRTDRLVGHVIGYPGNLPEIYVELEVNFYLLRRLVGVRNDSSNQSDKIRKIDQGESLMINVGSKSTGCRVLNTNSKTVRLIELVFSFWMDIFPSFYEIRLVFDDFD